jgi:hypothetical protein
MTEESDAAYFKRLSETAEDPVAFEKLVFETMVSAKQTKAEATATVVNTHEEDSKVTMRNVNAVTNRAED